MRLRKPVYTLTAVETVSNLNVCCTQGFVYGHRLMIAVQTRHGNVLVNAAPVLRPIVLRLLIFYSSYVERLCSLPFKPLVVFYVNHPHFHLFSAGYRNAFWVVFAMLLFGQNQNKDRGQQVIRSKAANTQMIRSRQDREIRPSREAQKSNLKLIKVSIICSSYSLHYESTL